MRRAVISRTKALAYSPHVRNVARKVVTAEPIRRIAEDKGLDGHLRRFAAETLPDGKYFAKLTIPDWKQVEGQPFRLLHDNVVVYGNIVEPPPLNFPLEYRNIVVDSELASEFELDIDIPYTLQIGHGSFSTPQQVDYDKRHGIKQHDDIFYSTRGNRTKPKRILFTFPDFSNSASRLSFHVEYLDQLSDAELSETLVVCFQDRYLTAGSYMTIDNSARSLTERVNAVIDGLVSQHHIAADQVMFFGISKGGSMAIHYAENHPQARLLVVAPQMNFSYYLEAPAFRDNLGRVPQLRATVQPEQLIRTYFREGRTIDYFYTNTDERSNYSLIEMVGDVPGLTKYRFDGTSADLARTSSPATLNIIRRFLQMGRDHFTTIDEVNTFPSSDSLGVQVRIDDSNAPTGAANWYLESDLGRATFRQIISDHNLPFVKFTSGSQLLQPTLDNLVGFSTVVAYTEDGDRWFAPFPEGAKLHLGYSPHETLPTSRLQLNTNRPTPYAIVRDTQIGRFYYECMSGSHAADRIDIHVVQDESGFDLGEARQHTNARYVASVTAVQDEDLIDLMIGRLYAASACSELIVYAAEGRFRDIALLSGEAAEQDSVPKLH